MAKSKRNEESNGGFERRLRPVARALRAALSHLVEEVTGGTFRSGRLVELLAVDKSLASRIIQALREEDDLDLLHRLPAPTGLRILVKTCQAKGVPGGLCAACEEPIVGFQTLIDSIPGGRGSIDGWISSRSAAARERNEHRSKQAIYKAMSYVIGAHCDTLATTLVLQPAQDSGHVDGFEVHQRYGLRRLRPSAPIALFSVCYDQPGEDGRDWPWIETLEEGLDGGDPGNFLIDDYCTMPLPGIDTVEHGKHHIFMLTEEEVSLEEPLNICSGYVLRHGWQRYASDTKRDECRAYLLNFPCKTLVREVFIHRDLWRGCNPELNLRLPNPSGVDPNRYDGLMGRLNTVDMHLPIEQLGRGLDKVALKPLPKHKQLLTESFERSGWDPDAFHGFRTQVRYPVPLITMTWWFSLPNKEK